MSFRARVLVVLLLAAALPVLLLGVFTFRANRDQLGAMVGRLQLQTTHELARASSAHVFEAVENLKLASSYLPLEGLGPDELDQVIRIPYRQIRPLNVVLVVDRDGQAVAPAVHAQSGEAGRDPVDDAALQRFARAVPLRAAVQTGAAVGKPYRSGASPRVAIAVRPSEGSVRLLAGELSLSELQRRVEELRVDGVRAFIVGSEGEVIAASDPMDGAFTAFAKDALTSGTDTVRTLEGAEGGGALAAFSPVPELGWGVIVARPLSEALLPAEKVKRYTTFWAGLAVFLAVGLGVVLARGVTGPVAQLSGAVREVAQGRYDQRVPAEGRDELSVLGASFNAMAQEIERRDAEIRAFNADLQRRVEEKTRELKDAQDQIERTRRLAALGSFSAGFTHELNNPLTGIIGLATILDAELKGSASAEMTQMLLKEARRMGRVIAEIRALADQQGDRRGARFPAARALLAAVDALKHKAHERGVTLEATVPDGALEVEGDLNELQKVVENLLQNALTATPGGGSVRAELTAVGTEAVRLSVKDTGKGIAPELHERIFDPFFTTKDDPASVGLGLSVAHRIVEAHHGKIRVESAPGLGATFSVVLPRASAAAHLT